MCKIYKCATGENVTLNVRPGLTSRGVLLYMAGGSDMMWLSLEDAEALRKQLKKIIKEIKDDAV